MWQRVVRIEVIPNAVGGCLLLLERLDDIEEVLRGKRDGHDTGGFIDEVVVSQKIALGALCDFWRRHFVGTSRIFLHWRQVSETAAADV